MITIRVLRRLDGVLLPDVIETEASFSEVSAGIHPPENGEPHSRGWVSVPGLHVRYAQVQEIRVEIVKPPSDLA